MKNNKCTWFEVRIGDMSTRHQSLIKAKKELAEMKKGYPKKNFMSKNNCQYWKKTSNEAKIYQIIKTSKKVI